MDPLAEKFAGVSSYVYCHNNPVNMIDPDGKADTFTSSGRFMSSDGIDNGQILVMIGASPVALSKLDYFKQGTAHAVSNIIGHYAAEDGYSGTYGVKSFGIENSGACTTESKSTFLNPNQFVKGTYDNKYDLLNTIEHEGFHKEENIKPENYTHMDHANVYWKQAHTDNFKKSSIDNKFSVAYGYAARVISSFAKDGLSFVDMTAVLNKFKKTTGIGVNYNVDATRGILEINSITIGGKVYPVRTEDVKVKVNTTPL